MRSIYNNSIKAKVLFHLRNYGDTKRSSFVTVFSEHYSQSVDRVIQWLLREGYVEEYKKVPSPKQKRVRFLTLTEKGKGVIRQLEEEHGEVLPSKDIATIKRPERKELVMRVFHACRAVGVMTEEDDERPSLPVLIGNRAPEPEEKKIIKRMQQDGAFYTLSEIRRASVEQHGDGPLNQTRCIGVIIRASRLFLVYNMGGKLIYFNSAVEIKTKADMMNLFADKSRLGGEPVVTSSWAPCILFANSYGAIAQLFFCRKTGRIPVDENGNPKGKVGELGSAKWDPNQDRITMKQLEKIFPDSYLIPFKHANALLGNITGKSVAQMDEAAVRWVTQQDILRPTGNQNGAQAVEKQSGDDVFVWLDNNLRTLYNVWKSRRKAFIIVPIPGAENGLAQVMGTRLRNVQTLLGEKLSTRQYDDYGNPIRERG